MDVAVPAAADDGARARNGAGLWVRGDCARDSAARDIHALGYSCADAGAGGDAGARAAAVRYHRAVPAENARTACTSAPLRYRIRKGYRRRGRTRRVAGFATAGA